MVISLLTANPDINHQDIYGFTALEYGKCISNDFPLFQLIFGFLAAGRGHYATLMVLLQAGAEPNLTDEQGYTPLKLGSK